MLLFSFLLACGAAYLLPCSHDTAIYDDVIRIHVIANSDSAQDQELKLKVRDGVIDTAGILLRGCTSEKQAEHILSNNLEALEEAAYEVQRECGYNYTIAAELTHEYYPSRNYDTFRLPCGKYRSLKIKIGDAQGKNWWCVIYPSFCLTPSVKNAPEITDVSPGMRYKIKFRILEIFQNLRL